jgi:hypothetical protein
MGCESQHFGGVKFTHFGARQMAFDRRFDQFHILCSGQKRYTTKRFVDLSGMNGKSLPNEVLFNHARRFRLESVCALQAVRSRKSLLRE